MKLLLFDIDGTLLLSGGAGRRALERAFFALHGVRDGMEDVPFAGRTDPAIVGDIYLRGLGRAPEPHEMRALFDAYIRLLEEEIARAERYAVMPGVAELLPMLAARNDLLLGLVTGNMERAAQIKLGRAGLSHHFRFGGYGSDSEDRVALTRLAIERGRRLAAQSAASDAPGRTSESSHSAAGATASSAFIIGDTPADVRAGKAARAFTIAVATGGADFETLAAESPDLLLRDLTDAQSLLSAIDGP
jgi:phosphoglycolate phosphatase-like HAD superfamily hydrolase